MFSCDFTSLDSLSFSVIAIFINIRRQQLINKNDNYIYYKVIIARLKFTEHTFTQYFPKQMINVCFSSGVSNVT